MDNSLFRKVVPVGVSVLVFDNQDNLLIGKRSVEDGHGLWATPGGFLEPGESLSECAVRETLEETGLLIQDVEFRGVAYSNSNNATYFDVCMLGNVHEKKNIDLKQVADVESTEWRWVPTKDLQNYDLWEPCKSALNIFFEKKNIYENHFLK